MSGLLLIVAAMAAAISACSMTTSDHGPGSDAADGSGGRSGAGTGGATASGGGGIGLPQDAGAATDAAVDASRDGGPSSNGGSSGAGGAAGCAVTLERISPPPPLDVEAGQGALLRMKASARGAPTAPIVWAWTVKLDDPSVMVATKAIDGAGAIVELLVATPGYYQISVRIVGAPLCASTQVVHAIMPQPAAFVVRATAAGYPAQDQRISLAATDPQPAASIQLGAGVPTILEPVRADDLGRLPSYVRVTLPASDFRIEGDTQAGPLSALLLPLLTYDVLIVPSGDYAPDLFSGTSGAWGQSMSIDPGLPVTATMRDGGGAPVVGARMVLRRGALPSTLGTSDASGAMTLRARAGTLSAYVVPPDGSGLPRATVGVAAVGDPGISFDAAAASLDLQMTWNAVSTAPLSIDVLVPGGGARMAGALVRATAHGVSAPVGSLVVRAGGGAPVRLDASGFTEVEAVTDAGGRATFPSLPLGTYDLTIIPVAGTSLAAAAITTAQVTLPSGGLTRSVALLDKGSLVGTLLPLSDSPGTRITALDRSITAPGTVVTAIVAADGGYVLSVDPGRDYELLAEPPPGSARGRAVLGTVRSVAGPMVVTTWSLPIGHLVHGRVASKDLGAGAAPIAGALVQVFCPSSSASCLDPTFPLADAISRADGTFDLRLPEPPPN